MTTSSTPAPSERMRVWLAWSSGKDAAWALHELRSAGDVEVVALLTTVNGAAERVAMHGVRRELLAAQAQSAGLPLVQVDLPFPCPNDVYEARMAAVCERAVAEGVCGVAFGDLYLEDVRRYREDMLARTPLEPLFPLFGRDTRELAEEMIAAGLQARLACVDSRQLDRSFAGHAFDGELLRALPAGVDPCGENGEFHTFAHAGPMFATPTPVSVGECVDRDGFVFADLLPGE